jgi:hypothetical protein
MLRHSRFIIILVFWLVLFGQPLSNSKAHAPFLLVAPRVAAPRPLPTIDGYCDPLEYQGAGRQSVQYQSRANWSYAPMRIIATASDLYFCTENMPLTINSDHAFAALYFDGDHSGGNTPSGTDMVFMLRDDNIPSVMSGDGVGHYMGRPDITDWQAVRGFDVNGLAWTAEYRISLSYVGGGAPWSISGFAFQHLNFRSLGDNFSWPYAAAVTNPNTWADLLWGVLPNNPTIAVDISRITQGLEYDLAGLTATQFIAGKDTLVRAQLYAFGSIQPLVYSACQVQQLSDTGNALAAPSYYPTTYGVTNPIQPLRFGYFNGSPTLDCWLPGSLLSEAGEYRFSMIVQMAGGQRQTLTIGTRTFVASGSLRILVGRLEFPTAHPEHLPWNAALDNNLALSMVHLARIAPFRSGAGNIRWSNAVFDRRNVPGVRYYVLPGVTRCMQANGQTMAQALGACDSSFRAFLVRSQQNLNAELNRLDTNNPSLGRRDRFDLVLLAVSTPSTGGGQAQGTYPNCTAGSGLDPNPNGGSGTVFAQELLHCLTLLPSSSPHSLAGNTAHSNHWNIPLVRGLAAVNFLTRQDVADIITVMNGATANVSVNNVLVEGWDWNYLRNQLYTMSRPSGGAISGLLANEPLYELTGYLDNNLFFPRHSGVTENNNLAPIPDDPSGTYQLEFIDGASSVLKQLRFVPPAQHTHGNQQPAIPVYLASIVPSGTVAVQLVHDQKILFWQSISANVPQMKTMQAQVSGKDMVLNWSAGDSDGDPLRYSVWLQGDANHPSQLLAEALGDTTFSLPLETLPAGVATFRVVVSDGYWTHGQSSESVSLPASTPQVSITYPATDTLLLAGQPHVLQGLGSDATDGMLDLTSLQWSLDGTVLGSGATLETSLPVGTHSLSLMGKNSAGLTDTDTITITIVADDDKDRLPAAYEQQYKCLSSVVDDGNNDPDSDGLSSYGEWQTQSNPCLADTDSDGMGDGDERNLGSNPLFPDETFPIDLAVDADTLDFGDCHTAKPISVPVVTQAIWQASSPNSWIQLLPNGGQESLTVQVDCSGLMTGNYQGVIWVGSSTSGFWLDVQMNIPYQVYLPLLKR